MYQMLFPSNSDFDALLSIGIQHGHTRSNHRAPIPVLLGVSIHLHAEEMARKDQLIVHARALLMLSYNDRLAKILRRGTLPTVIPKPGWLFTIIHERTS